MAIDIGGALHQETVFDGHSAWVLDSSGEVHELSDGILEGVISGAYEASASFLFPNRLAGHVDTMGQDVGQNAYIVRLKPEGGLPVTVFLDKETFLPTHEMVSVPTGTRTTTFSGWREFAGIKWPSEFRQSSGDPNLDLVVSVEQVGINCPLTPEVFERPAEAAPPIHFSTGTHEATSLVEVYGEYVFIPVRVNGGKTAWFLLDNGANETVVSKTQADIAGLAYEGALGTEGASGSAQVGLAKNVVLNLPGVEVATNTVAIANLSFAQRLLGRPLDGLLGYDVISRFVMRVDYEHAKVTFYDPTSFVPDPRATALPITFMGNVPKLTAEILLPGHDPIEAGCLVDSGAGLVALTAHFVEVNRVLQSVAPAITVLSTGLSGESNELESRIPALQLGPYVLRQPVATFSPDTKGLLASHDFDALIGGEILSRFTTTFDYRNLRIVFEPNNHFADPFSTDASGLSLQAIGKRFDQFEITAIVPGSPAEQAGLQRGDIIKAVDMQPASALDLAAVRRILQNSGVTVRLTVERSGRTLNAILNLSARF